MKHIIFYSGGLGSWATAKRVIHKFGYENVLLVFTDTLIEDEDLYRFLYESSKKLKCELVHLKDGRTPWEVYKDRKFLGNSRQANCSTELKQKVAKQYIRSNFKSDEVILYLGIDWSEEHRTKSVIENWKPYKVSFPMCKEPFIDKNEVIEMLKEDGIEVPRLYKLGFSHNNCGGFCCRAGIGHFANLYEKLPNRFFECEAKEQEIRDFLNKDVTMLKKTRNGVQFTYSLADLRKDIELKKDIDRFDIGGCGCFVEEVTK